jgi:hypothetical protein
MLKNNDHLWLLMILETAFNRTITIFVLILLVIIAVFILPSKEELGIKIAGQVAKNTSLNEPVGEVESVADTISETQTNIGTSLLNFISENSLLVLIVIFICVIGGFATGWIGKLRGLLR